MKRKIYIFSTILIILDQLIKIIITNNIKLGSSIEVIENFFSITYITNDGGAFNIFSGNLLLLLIITIIAIVLFNRYFLNKNDFKKTEIISYSMILGGIIGNFIDRLLFNKVIDYISFNLFGYAAPIFNFADILIVVGVGILLIITLKGSEKNDIKSK